ncbi:MAG: hypothetical protein LBD03_01300 [Methanobrevibacter sp.]|nr:hypothetical protein [Candidatus Methanovirga procula]
MVFNDIRASIHNTGNGRYKGIDQVWCNILDKYAWILRSGCTEPEFPNGQDWTLRTVVNF